MTTYLPTMEEPFMTCQQPWFSKILTGAKTIEGKPGFDGKFTTNTFTTTFITIVSADVTADDDIVEGLNSITVELVAVRWYSSLINYLTGDGWRRCAPHAASFDDAFAKYCQITYKDESDKEPAYLPRVEGTNHVFVFSPERVELKGGINALEIRIPPKK